jgi:CheY-like chemotaxis protein
VVTAPRVLVVENEPAIREVVALVLTDEGCEVRAHNGGRDALRLLRRWQPDVVVLDLRLPDHEGETFLHACREDVAGETPILVMSASSNLDHHAARLGVDSILPKPFDIDDLCRAVHRLAVDHPSSARRARGTQSVSERGRNVVTLQVGANTY